MGIHSFTCLQGMSTEALTRVVAGVDVANAQCQYDADRDLILGNIRCE